MWIYCFPYGYFDHRCRPNGRFPHHFQTISAPTRTVCSRIDGNATENAATGFPGHAFGLPNFRPEDLRKTRESFFAFSLNTQPSARRRIRNDVMNANEFRLGLRRGRPNLKLKIKLIKLKCERRNEFMIS